MTSPLRIYPPTKPRLFRPIRPPSFPLSPASLDGLSPAVGVNWASMVNTLLLLMFQKPSSRAITRRTTGRRSISQSPNRVACTVGATLRASMAPRSSASPQRATCTTTPTQLDRRQHRRHRRRRRSYPGHHVGRVPSALIGGSGDGSLGMMVVMAAAVTDPVHKVLHCPTPLASSMSVTTGATRWHNCRTRSK